jgi:hypothetical protein
LKVTSEVEKRLERLEREVRRLRRLVSGGGGDEVLMEEDGVTLMRGGDLFGSYVVVDRDGSVHMYGDRKAAEKTFRNLVGRRSSGTAPQG